MSAVATDLRQAVEDAAARLYVWAPRHRLRCRSGARIGFAGASVLTAAARRNKSAQEVIEQ